MKPYRFFTLLFILPCFLLGQNEFCREQLNSIIQHYQELQKPVSGKAHQFNFEVQANPRFGPMANSSQHAVDVKIIITDKAYYYDSNIVSMRIDAQDQYIIMHPQKLILKRNSDEDVGQLDHRQNLITSIQDSIMSKGAITSCSIDDGNVMKVTVKPSQNISKSLQIDRLEYTIDRETDRILDVTTYYNEPHKLRSQKVTYLEIRQNTINQRIKQASQYIYNSDGSLNDKYAYYKLIDQTK